MNNFSFTKYSNQVWILVLAVVMSACSQFEAQGPSDDVTLAERESLFRLEELNSSNFNAMVTGTPSTPVSTIQLITPYIIPGDNPGGNRTCEEVAAAFGLDAFQFSSDRVNYNDGSFDASFPDGFTVTTNGTTVSWSFIPPAGKCLDAIAFIVKGSADANVYVYGPDIYSDAGLASPVNASGGSAGLSNLTICYSLRDCDDQKCYDGETAWAAGTRYVTRGNWATYSSKTALMSDLGVKLFAGQTMDAGTVQLVGGNIVITLNAGWRFAGTDENVKIQHYSSTPPASNPAPGLFATKGTATSSPFSIAVPDARFYGIHVDVEREVACPI
jgi:hypothetical protein